MANKKKLPDNEIKETGYVNKRMKKKYEEIIKRKKEKK